MGYRKSAPWMPGHFGDNRATNMPGAKAQETFIDSTVGTGGRGVLRVDDCSNVKRTGICGTFFITGIAGYSCYGIGNAVDRFYSCDLFTDTCAATGKS